MFVGENPLGSSVAWDFVKDNFDALAARRLSFGKVMRSIVMHFSTQSRLEDVQNFLEKIEVSERVMATATEFISNAISWRTEHASEICSSI